MSTGKRKGGGEWPKKFGWPKKSAIFPFCRPVNVISINREGAKK